MQITMTIEWRSLLGSPVLVFVISQVWLLSLPNHHFGIFFTFLLLLQRYFGWLEIWLYLTIFEEESLEYRRGFWSIVSPWIASSLSSFSYTLLSLMTIFFPFWSFPEKKVSTTTVFVRLLYLRFLWTSKVPSLLSLSCHHGCAWMQKWHHPVLLIILVSLYQRMSQVNKLCAFRWASSHLRRLELTG